MPTFKVLHAIGKTVYIVTHDLGQTVKSEHNISSSSDWIFASPVKLIAEGKHIRDKSLASKVAALLFTA